MSVFLTPDETQLFIQGILHCKILIINEMQLCHLPMVDGCEQNGVGGVYRRNAVRKIRESSLNFLSH